MAKCVDEVYFEIKTKYLKCAFHFITWGSGQNNEREGKKEIEKEGKVSVKKKKKKVCEVEKGKVRSATAEERRKK